MNNPAQHDYLVLSRGQWDPALPPERIQQAIDQFYVWHAGEVDAGRMKPGQRLQTAKKLVSRAGITDGPFTEAKEVVGGYWFIVARSLDEAAQIASGNPCIACGLSFEIRPVDPERASAFVDSNETPART